MYFEYPLSKTYYIVLQVIILILIGVFRFCIFFVYMTAICSILNTYGLPQIFILQKEITKCVYSIFCASKLKLFLIENNRNFKNIEPYSTFFTWNSLHFVLLPYFCPVKRFYGWMESAGLNLNRNYITGCFFTNFYFSFTKSTIKSITYSSLIYLSFTGPIT